MQAILVNCSVVLLTKDYIPSVNHEFLANKKIVPEDFQKNPNSLSTPVVSQINYKNGFNIKVEPERTEFQFLNLGVAEKNNLNKLLLLKEISSKYVSVFEYIKYQAVGINFVFIRDDLNYHSVIEQIVKKDNPHTSFENNKGTINSINLSYSVNGTTFNVTVNRAEKKLSRSPQNVNINFVPLFQINIHYLGEYANNKASIISNIQDNYKQAKKFIGRF